MITLTLIIRFLLEIGTVLGIFSGLFLKQDLISKLLFFLLGLAAFLLWARYGAPKSPHVLIGLKKFLLELLVYGIGIFSFYNLFGVKIGTIYMILVIFNLSSMYLLHLQGH